MTGPRFSVVIPTLQLSDLLPDLIRTYDRHPLVGEILVINNASTPLAIDAGKLRVLGQRENIFVNPAWNLGAREAGCELLAISNDDIAIDGDLLDRAAARLDSGGVGIIGGDLRPEGFGVLMMMATSSYAPIPEELKIWQGDDYLFHQQTGHNYVFRGFRLDTPHHVTAGREEFNVQKAADFALYMRELHPRSRYWGQPGWDFRAVRAAVAVRRRLRPLPQTWESRRGAP